MLRALLCSFALLAVLTLAAEAEGAQSIQFSSGSSALGIPFILKSDRIYIQAYINDLGPFWLALDTGASVCTIDEKRVGQLHLQTAGKFKATVMGGSETWRLVKGISFRLPGVTLVEPTTTTFSADSIPKSLDETMDGILGSALFQNTVVEINYAAGEINLYDPKTYQYTGAQSPIPLDFDQNHIPMVQASILPLSVPAITGKFVIDTGLANPITLNAPFTTKHQLLNTSSRTFPLGGAQIGGKSQQRIGRIQQLLMGKFAISHPIAAFSQDKRGALARMDCAGFIGGAVMRRFNVVFDYPHQRMIMEPNRDFTEPFVYHYYGMRWKLSAATLQGNRVESVDPQSPASGAGLRPGDVIIAIDGQPTETMKWAQAKAILQQEGPDNQLQEHLFNIQRGDRRLQVKYRLWKL